MKSGMFLGLFVSTILSSPGLAVESYDLDAVEITYPGEYLGPANLYRLVPPPTADSNAEGTANIYNSQTIAFQMGRTAGNTGSADSGYAAPAGVEHREKDKDNERLKVRIIAGTDNATEIPVSVLREHFKDSENIDVVGEGKIYDILVQVETMKLETSPVVFIVVNAYKDFGNRSLIVYNDYGYLGDMRLNEGSVGFAENLEVALEEEFAE